MENGRREEEGEGGGGGGERVCNWEDVVSSKGLRMQDALRVRGVNRALPISVLGYDSPPVAPNETAWNPISPGCKSLAVSGRIRSLYACTKDKDRRALFFDPRVRLGNPLKFPRPSLSSISNLSGQRVLFALWPTSFE
jgi:hypothetical protein